MNALYRWIVLQSVTTFIVAYLVLYHDILNWMITNDPTRISLVITGVYVLSSLYIGLGIFRKKISVSLLEHVSSSIMGLGLIGTILATFWLFKDVHGLSDAKQMITIVLNGIGTAQITTLFGLGGAWLLDQQRAFVIGIKND
ncbi:hypothetical protein F67_I3_11_063 [Rhizobium phage RHph_I3_11]|nr:hypothetical protein F67_I3_11_063 [Rhizobium phage RHph_I3_11]